MPRKSSKSNKSNGQASPLLVGLLILSLVVVVIGGGYLLLTSPDGSGVPSITVGLPEGFLNRQDEAESPSDVAPLTAEDLEALPEELRAANTAGRAPLPTGSQRYSISSQGTGPKFTEAVINPLDAQTGQQQTITAKTDYGIPVQTVVATLITDGDPLKVDMRQVSTDGTTATWESTVTMPSSTDGKYGLTLTATAQDGQKSRPVIELYFR